MKLPQISIATKLYAIFALLATVTVALAAVAVVNARHHAGADRRVRGGAGRRPECRARQRPHLCGDDGGARHLSRARRRRRRGACGQPAVAQPTASARWSPTGRSGCAPDDAPQFVEFSPRVAQFQNFARELAQHRNRRQPAGGARVGRHRRQPRHAEGAERGSRAARPRSTPSAPRASMREIDRHIDQTAWLIEPARRRWRSCWPPPAPSSSGSAVARPLATDHPRHRDGRRRRRPDGHPYGDRRDEIGALGALDRGVPGRDAAATTS